MAKADKMHLLKRKPKVKALHRAKGGDRAAGLAGLAVVVVLALLALLWNSRTGALSSSVNGGGSLVVPTLDVVSGLVVAVLSVVILFLGWPLYRLTVILTGFVLGASVAGPIGWFASSGNQSAALVAGLVGGIVGGVAAWPTEIAIRTFSGALAGMLLGLAMGSGIGSPVAVIGCALGGLLLGGALTFLFYRALIICYSSILGALGTVFGAICLWKPEATIEVRPLYLGIAAGLALLGIGAQRSLGKEEVEEEE